MEDYDAAAHLFRHLAPTYGRRKWLGNETAILEMHGACLRELDRPEDFVHISLKSLSKAIQLEELGIRKRRSRLRFDDEPNEKSHTPIREIVAVSTRVATAIRVPMTEFFSEIRLDPHVRHLSSEDGFCLNLSFQSKLQGKLEDVQLDVNLIPLNDASHGEIILHPKKPLQIPEGPVTFTVFAQVLRSFHFAAFV